MRLISALPLLLAFACSRTPTRNRPDTADHLVASASVGDASIAAFDAREHEPDGGSAEPPVRPFPVELPPGAEYRRDLFRATTGKCMESWTVYSVPMPLDEAVAFYEQRLGSPIERRVDEVVFDLGDPGRGEDDGSEGLRTLRIREERVSSSSGRGGHALLRYVDRYPCLKQQGDEPATTTRYPSRADVNAKLEGVRERVRTCTGDRSGTALAAIRFEGSSGRVLGVEVSGDFAGPAAACIADVIRGVSVPPFPGSSVSVNYAYRF